MSKFRNNFNGHSDQAQFDIASMTVHAGAIAEELIVVKKSYAALECEYKRLGEQAKKDADQNKDRVKMLESKISTASQRIAETTSVSDRLYKELRDIKGSHNAVVDRYHKVCDRVAGLKGNVTRYKNLWKKLKEKQDES